MACTNCKSKIPKLNTDTKGNSTNINYFIKIIIFLLIMLLLPVITLILIIVIFRVIVLSKNINILPILLHIGNRIFNSEKIDDTEDDFEDFDYEIEDDIIILNQSTSSK